MMTKYFTFCVFIIFLFFTLASLADVLPTTEQQATVVNDENNSITVEHTQSDANNINSAGELTAKSTSSALEKAQKPNSILPIDDFISSLIALSVSDKSEATLKLRELDKQDKALNFAEQYLVHVSRANIANASKQTQEVIRWVNEAIKLEPNIADKQLNMPLFADSYLMLATIYAKQGLYQQAYDTKKQYIKRYFSQLSLQKDQRVKHLNEKYNIEKKHEENELLSQNNQIKHFALLSAQAQSDQQRRNIVIFIIAGIILFLLVLRQFKIRRALTALAKTDSLTQLPNRRLFFTRGDKYMADALSANKELCVLMLDIDTFKDINDKFGHDIGDSVICHVATLASETMRSRDLFARIGGEEFAAILPDATIEQARATAEHIREKIQDSCCTNGDTPIDVTVSIGIASIKDVSDNFDGILHAADMAMYQAKSGGRNQVCKFSEINGG